MLLLLQYFFHRILLLVLQYFLPVLLTSLVTLMYCVKKTGEPIKMPFGGDSCGSKEPCIRWGQDLTNPFAAARGGTTCDAAFRQNFFDHLLMCIIELKTAMPFKRETGKYRGFPCEYIPSNILGTCPNVSHYPRN